MRIKTLAILVALAVAGGLLLAWSGLVSVAASSGHYAITTWFLHYTMRQAVKTQSSLVEVPSGVLDDAGQVALGAVHYADGCAPCHGAPGEPRSPLVLAMTPPPPWLPRVIPTWDTEALFWIVRHGVKYSGMPAWPAQARADEVWAVVAFLRALPDLDAATYRRLVAGHGTRAADGEKSRRQLSMRSEFDNILAGCARCHGRDGAGRPEGGVPWIGGQSQTYLAATLLAYAEGRRASGIMQPQAAAVPYEQLDKLAAHYARQQWAAEGDRGSDPGADNHGESIALPVCRREAFRPARVVTARHPDTLTIHASQARTPASSRASWCCFATARAAAPPMGTSCRSLSVVCRIRTSPPSQLSMLRRAMLREIRAAVVVADGTELVRHLLLTALLGELVAFTTRRRVLELQTVDAAWASRARGSS